MSSIPPNLQWHRFAALGELERQCGGQTVYRFGKKGRFLSCARYPKCKFAAPVDRDGNPVSPEQTDVACPKCESPMLLRRGRFGMFLSCARYPECAGIVALDKKGLIAAPKIPPLATDLSCPKCNAQVDTTAEVCPNCGLDLSGKCPQCRAQLPDGADRCPNCDQP